MLACRNIRQHNNSNNCWKRSLDLPISTGSSVEKWIWKQKTPVVFMWI